MASPLCLPPISQHLIHYAFHITASLLTSVTTSSLSHITVSPFIHWCHSLTSDCNCTTLINAYSLAIQIMSLPLHSFIHLQYITASSRSCVTNMLQLIISFCNSHHSPSTYSTAHLTASTLSLPFTSQPTLPLCHLHSSLCNYSATHFPFPFCLPLPSKPLHSL